MKKKIKKILRFFDQNLYGKLTFFLIFYYIFIEFLRLLRKDIPVDIPFFLDNLFGIGGGGGNVLLPYSTANF